MDGGAWWAAVYGVAKGRTRLSDFTFTFHFHALEKEMATHSSVLAWRIRGTEEPGGLLSMGSHRVGHDWSDLAAAVAAALIEVSWVEANSIDHWSYTWWTHITQQRQNLEGSGEPLKMSDLKGINTSLVAQMVKNLPAVWETWVRSLGWEDTLEKGIATHSSILAWRIPWTL